MGLSEELGKSKKRFVLDLNRARGTVAEDRYVATQTVRGYEVQKTGRGSDYRERRTDLYTGRTESWTYVEVKSGNAELSPLQKETKKNTKRYRTERF